MKSWLGALILVAAPWSLSAQDSRATRAQICPRSPSYEGAVAGRITSAATSDPVVGAAVVVLWSDLAIDRDRVESRRHEAKAVVDTAGNYRVCGVPSEAPLTLRVTRDGFYPVEIDASIPFGGIGRRDLRMAERRSDAPTSTIRFRVVDDSGAAVQNGEAVIASMEREAPIERGQAAIGGVPAGTWSIVVRAVGYRPVALSIETPLVGDSAERITLQRIPHLLDSVLVRSRPLRGDSATLREIQDRLRAAHGTLFRADHLSVRNANYAADPIRMASGFRWRGSTTVEARAYADNRGRQRPCLSTDSMRSPGAKVVAIYLNGSRVGGGLEMLNRMVPPADILAIEAYPDVISAPFLWRTNDACAVVAYWTKR